jgi:tetratricopeptide (TPR) repeat protein
MRKRSCTMSVEKQFDVALEYAKKGDLKKAELICKKLLEIHPNYIDALCLLGEIYYHIEDYESAITYLRKTLQFNHTDALTYYTLANACKKSHLLDDAINYYQKAIDLNHHFEDACYNLGIALKEKGDIEAAIHAFQKASQLNPTSSDVLNNLGLSFHEQGKFDEAITYFQKALQLHPDYTLAMNNLGLTLHEKGEHDEAIQTFQEVITREPDDAYAYYNLGIVFMKQQQHDKAIEAFQTTIKKDPNFENAYYNMGIAFSEKGQLDNAIHLYQQTLRVNPSRPDVYNNLAIAYEEKGDIGNAIPYFKKAVELTPEDAEIHWNLSLALLLSGDLLNGWKEYQWRFGINDFRKNLFLRPLWNGSDITGKTLLIHSEQGFGDTLQFIRYASLVAERGAKVIVQCPRELVSLLRSVEGIWTVIAFGEELPEFDVHCPLLSLPFIFGTTIETVPSKIPYIIADPLSVQRWEGELLNDKERIKIGLVWAGGAKNKNDKHRSLLLTEFTSLAGFEDIIFYSLQKGDAAIQTSTVPEGMRLIDYTEELEDFSDTAALIQNIDLIISVDTAVAHLAGALGKPVWTLLPFVPDWRWMLNREDTPWYPTMRLFRQPSPGNWESVMQKLRMVLRDFRFHRIHIPSK